MTTHFQRVLSCFTLVLISLNGFSAVKSKLTASASVSNYKLHSDHLTFIKNKGQLADETGKVLGQIKYYGKQAGVSVYCEASKLSFVYEKITTADYDHAQPDKAPATSTVELSRLELEFLGSNPMVEIKSEKVSKETTNYYLAHTPESGVTNVNSYSRLSYLNIYPHIDMIVEAAKESSSSLEYSFVVHAGGKVSDIKMRWNGAQNTEQVKSGGMVYKSNLGEMMESAPKSYESGKLVSSRIETKGGVNTFHVADYNPSQDLIIDPTLSWATYYGGNNGRTIGEKVAADKFNNVYLVGYTYSTSGIASSGAFQTDYATNRDAFMARFDSSGSLKWSTYYGGNDYDAFYGIGTDDSGYVYAQETTKSDTGIATSASYQTAFGGFTDAFTSKFDSTGRRI